MYVWERGLVQARAFRFWKLIFLRLPAFLLRAAALDQRIKLANNSIYNFRKDRDPYSVQSCIKKTGLITKRRLK
jgi:hypothetical protein